MIVMKFGGTSTQDAGAVENVVKIVAARIDRKPIVVISAIAQATNILEKAGRLAAEGRSDEARSALLRLAERHDAIAQALIKDPGRHRDLRGIIAASLQELEELMKGLSILRELTPRSLDTIYCFGELLSSRIVAFALEEYGVSSRWIDTKDFMVTDDRYNSASPDMELLESRLPEIILPLVQRGVVPVTQGFIGITRSGHRTTMGRESSDYSASVIGSVLKVDDVQIWTDVDGILTSDPRIVSAPKKVKALSFAEAFDLSYFGAKVLHPKTILPAVQRNVPIHVYNSQHSELSGTLITSTSSSGRPCVKSVAYKRNMGILTVTPKNRYGQYIFWEHVYSILTKYGVPACLTLSSDYGISIVLDHGDEVTTIAPGLREVGSVDLQGGKGIVCLVGSRLRSVPQFIERVFRSLSDFPVSLISFGASSSSLCVLIDDRDVPDAVNTLHREFFDNPGDEFEALAHFPV